MLTCRGSDPLLNSSQCIRVAHEVEPLYSAAGWERKSAFNIVSGKNTDVSSSTNDRPAAEAGVLGEELERSVRNGRLFEPAVADQIELQDPTGDKPGIVVVEVPAKPQWCEIRNTVFSWTPTRFPSHTSSAKKLTLNQTPVATVIGKAFFDIGHSLKNQKLNQRSHFPTTLHGKLIR